MARSMSMALKCVFLPAWQGLTHALGDDDALRAQQVVVSAPRAQGLASPPICEGLRAQFVHVEHLPVSLWAPLGSARAYAPGQGR